MITVGQKYTKRGFVFTVIKTTEKSVTLQYEQLTWGFDYDYMKVKRGVVSKQHLLEFYQLIA
ncbi:MAG TPA: hypothetical protein DDY18_09030 [Flavobacterium sp.]|jgi:hypothetical protein|nr:hypothetical protein [Flavobacterium sp.]